MWNAKIEEVARSKDSDSDSDDVSLPHYTIAIWPVGQDVTYIMIATCREKVSLVALQYLCNVSLATAVSRQFHVKLVCHRFLKLSLSRQDINGIPHSIINLVKFAKIEN